MLISRIARDQIALSRDFRTVIWKWNGIIRVSTSRLGDERYETKRRARGSLDSHHRGSCAAEFDPAALRRHPLDRPCRTDSPVDRHRRVLPAVRALQDQDQLTGLILINVF